METTSRVKSSATSAWAALITGATVVEFYALAKKQRHRTLSHAMRCTFRTDTPTGRKLYVTWLVATMAWLTVHILETPVD